MKRNVMAAIGFTGLGIVLTIMIISAINSNALSSLFAKDIGTKNPPVTLNSTVKAINDAYVAASNAVTPAVVSISVEMEVKASKSPLNDEFHEFFKFFGGPQGEDDQAPRRSEASGSGVIISSDGYIVTNNHVVENATEKGITVTTSDRKEYKKAKLIGRDPLTDLAVIKVEAENLTAVHFGEIEEVKVGEFVIAVGNPLGLNSTVTNGIISAIGRGQLNLGNKNRYSVENYIQTDAAINPGNSGGGLFSLDGSLIGINTAIATPTGSFVGYGFAIPVDLVKAVVQDLIDNGKINRGYLGVSIKTVNETDAKAVGLKKVQGVLVNDVLKKSPAEKAGIEKGDIILDIDGREVKTSNELQGRVVLHRVGDVLKLNIWRDGKTIEKSVKLEPKDGEEETAENSSGSGDDKDYDSAKPIKFDKLGFTVDNVNADMKKKFGVENGVYISKVERYSVASQQGLAPNGIIVKIDRKDVSSPDQLKKFINSKKEGDAFMLQVKYEDTYAIISLEIPS
jgi:serine protease Do